RDGRARSLRLDGSRASAYSSPAMKPISRFILVAIFAAATTVVATTAPPSLGTVVILDNGQVIEGRVERVGERYRLIKDGGETWLPATRVQFVCPDLPAAYRPLSERIGAPDAEPPLPPTRSPPPL